jgi:hypothetical protein
MAQQNRPRATLDLANLTLTRREMLLYTMLAVVGVGVAACDAPPAPLPELPSELPSTGNVRVSRDGFAGHAEPYVSVNPSDPLNLLGACMAESEGGVIAAYASFDGGASWVSHGALEDSGMGRDPTVTFDAEGRGYVCANTDDLHVWRTDDGGRSFAAPVLATRGRKLDHPWLAADPTRGQLGATHLYAAWTGGTDNANLEFARSTDAGRSFEAPRVIDAVRGIGEANLASPMLAAGPGGTVHVVYGVWPPIPRVGLRPEFPAPVRVITSTDHGETWDTPADLGTAVMEVRVAPETNVPALPTVVAHRDGPFAAVAFVVRQPGTSFSDIAVCVWDRPNGRWTEPKLMPRQSEDTIYTQPQLAIDQVGRLALSAFAHRAGLVDVVLFRARPFSDDFNRPEVVTSRPFDPSVGTMEGKHGAWWIGDYQGLASAAGTTYPFWNDPRTGRLEIFTQPISSGPTPRASTGP